MTRRLYIFFNTIIVIAMSAAKKQSFFTNENKKTLNYTLYIYFYACDIIDIN